MHSVRVTLTHTIKSRREICIGGFWYNFRYKNVLHRVSNSQLLASEPFWPTHHAISRLKKFWYNLEAMVQLAYLNRQFDQIC